MEWLIVWAIDNPAPIVLGIVVLLALAMTGFVAAMLS